MKIFPFFVFLVFFLAGCFGLTGVSAEYEMAVACRAYEPVVTSLAAFKSRMKADQVEKVNRARAVLRPACESVATGKATAEAASVAAVTGAMQQLLAVEKEVKK